MPELCALHGKKLDQLCHDVTAIRTAIQGCETMGVRGIVHFQHDHDARLNRIERRMGQTDLRAAGVAGFVSGLIFAVKALLFGK